MATMCTFGCARVSNLSGHQRPHQLGHSGKEGSRRRRRPKRFTLSHRFRKYIIRADLPVLHPATGEAVGTIDVESDRPNVFSPRDKDFFEDCANAILALWTETPK